MGWVGVTLRINGPEWNESPFRTRPQVRLHCIGLFIVPRNISFALTTDQIRNQTKTVTRRKGWKFLKRGDILNACVKCMGLKPGEQIERLGQIFVKDVRREPLFDMVADLSGKYGRDEAAKEGFPEMSGPEFVTMFCEHMGGDESQEVTRIEFGYMPEYADGVGECPTCGPAPMKEIIVDQDGVPQQVLCLGCHQTAAPV